MTSHVSAPTLTTPRLILSAHTTADYEAGVELWSDPLVTRFISGRPSTREEVWSRLLRYAGLWALLGFGYWAVRDRVSGAFLGDVGLADFHRDVAPAVESMPEAGWVLRPAAHGQGFATEALGAVLAWSDAHLAGPSGGAAWTFCLIDPDNRASVRVAEKCGFRPYGRVTYQGQPTSLFRRVPASLPTSEG